MSPYLVPCTVILTRSLDNNFNSNFRHVDNNFVITLTSFAFWIYYFNIFGIKMLKVTVDYHF